MTYTNLIICRLHYVWRPIDEMLVSILGNYLSVLHKKKCELYILVLILSFVLFIMVNSVHQKNFFLQSIL